VKNFVNLHLGCIQGKKVTKIPRTFGGLAGGIKLALKTIPVDNSPKTVDKLPEMGKTRQFVRFIVAADTPIYRGYFLPQPTYLFPMWERQKYPISRFFIPNKIVDKFRYPNPYTWHRNRFYPCNCG